MTVHIIHGDCRAILATLPAESVQCVVTSPPYFGLRDYGTATWDGGDPGCDHGAARIERRQSECQPTLNGGAPGSLRDKPVTACACGAHRIDSQIGLEPSPQEYVDELVAVFREVRRVLRTDGTLWLNLGDSYASAWPCNRRNLIGQGSLPDGKRANRPPRMGDGLKEKDLMMIPARVALALQADGWWLRSEIIWSKAAPMPESVRDRPTCAHEKVFLLTKAASYFYDADAVAEPAEGKPQNRFTKPEDHPKGLPNRPRGNVAQPPGGGMETTRNIRNVWHLNPEPFPGAHFATMPATLAERCIKAGTSEKGQCPCCGAPWARQTTVMRDSRDFARQQDLRQTNGSSNRTIDGVVPSFRSPTYETTCWQPSCACPEHMPIPQTVLDPFAGAGTTLLVADRLQRHGIGIELNPEYAAMAEERVTGDAPLFGAVA